MSAVPAPDAAYELPYSALARVYDRWMAADEVPYDQWVAFAKERFAEADLQVKTVLDVCCGTGMTIRTLQDQGFRVTGVDASASMLDVARTRADAGTELRHLTLPDQRLAELGPFDAALVCFDSANYFTGDGALGTILHHLAGALRPGGVLVFDLSTRPSFEAIAALGEFSEDFGDFSYVWNTRHVPDSPYYEYLVSLYVPEGEQYRRVVERHPQRWFSRDEVESALRDAGFTAIRTSDNYTDRLATDATRRDTWSARLPAGSIPR